MYGGFALSLHPLLSQIKLLHGKSNVSCALKEEKDVKSSVVGNLNCLLSRTQANFTMLFESSPWLCRWLPISLTTAFPINMASLTFLWLMRTKMSLPLPSLTKTATGQARNSQRPSSFLMARTNPKGKPPPGLGTNLAGQGLISTRLLSRLTATDNILVHIPMAYYSSALV